MSLTLDALLDLPDAPDSWSELDTPEDRRAFAATLVQRHREVMDALGALLRDGGAAAVVRAVLATHERQGAVSATDVERLTAIFAHLATSVGRSGDDLHRRLRELVQSVEDDPASSAVALAAAGVAEDSVDRARSEPGPADPWLVGYADGVGVMLGGSVHPAHMYTGGIAASSVAEHLHVSVGWH